jgi:hypothetical protein
MTMGKASIIAWMVLIVSCGCTTSQVNTYPKLIGHKNGEKILICDLEGSDMEAYHQNLTQWTNENINKKLPSLSTINYWDAVFNLKQYGIQLPSFESFDTTSLDMIYQSIGVKYILIGKIISTKENILNELSNPNYQVREATLQFRLIDSVNKTVVWHCSSRIQVSPFIQSKENQKYYYNVTSSN